MSAERPSWLSLGSGRPSLPADKREAVERLLAEGTSIAKTAKAVGVGVATVHRIKQASATAA
ncbi:helix-turn-helix domain-containing protein [Caenispirillum salinarum]|uniref:helix-turn-helix domain-containing protein n=1 Tax=Caenispirillum salinarum TaxID=859058 RepID=UPI00384B54C9